MKKPRVLCLMGPTASGKTDLALALCARFACNIVSVDSAMIYRGMDIGTAKPSADIQRMTPHRLLDIRDPCEGYSAADFCADAKREIEDITAQGKTALLVGGTSLYFHALQQGLSCLPSADASVRAQLSKDAAQYGQAALYQRLCDIDSVAAMRIHPHDTQRLYRALEVYYLTGTPLTHLQGTARASCFEYSNVAIIPEDRTFLHQRIAERFDAMLSAGFIDEVACLRARGDLTLDKPAMRAVGYRQAWEYLDGYYDYSTFRERAIIATRQLAKRQLTWLKGWQGVEVLTHPKVDTLAALFRL